MKNRNVGYLISGLAIILGVLIILFDSSMRKAVALSCSHGPTCSMYDVVSTQTWIALAIIGVVFFIGVFFIFVREEREVVVKKVKEQKKKISLEGLDSREKIAVKLIQENGGIFQADLMEKLGVGKVGLTRLLDKLEAKQIIERKRRGMNNFIVLKI